jgi:hypothetical protein
MWSPSRIKSMRRMAGVVALVGIAGSMLAGCSDIYFDRRETVALSADDHIGVNRVAQMIDPWPRDVGRREIAFNGQKMQAGVERYRTGRAIPPVNVTTSSTAYQQAEQAAAATLNSTNPTGLSAPAAPVK